jgi:hypothetical protein
VAFLSLSSIKLNERLLKASPQTQARYAVFLTHKGRANTLDWPRHDFGK